MRKTKRDWLVEGLKVLAKSGAAALKIDLLTTRLGVTKGSFYHHFKNYQDFKKSLLTFVEEQGALEIIELSKVGETPHEKMERLVEATLRYPPAVEVSIRAWALQDETVRCYQIQIDKRRMEYLMSLCIAMLDDEKKGAVMAQLVHAIYIGSQQLIPPIEGEALENLYQEFLRLYGVTLS